jgi:hypothetical protein
MANEYETSASAVLTPFRQASHNPDRCLLDILLTNSEDIAVKECPAVD